MTYLFIIGDSIAYASFDEVHLSPEGHETIFQLVKETLVKKKLV